MKITFLGTAGGRFSTISQKRMSGGFRIDNLEGKNYHVDPGPGALVRTYQFGLDPRNIDGVFISHAHTDHYNDAEILIEAMTRGMTRENGVIMGSPSVFKGYQQWGPCISKYHRSKSRNIILKLGDKAKINKNVSIKGCKTIHGDPAGIGFQIETNHLKLSYTSDTKYFDDLKDYHEGADILIASVLRPGYKAIKGHMSSRTFTDLLKEVQPKLAIITHFGLKMLSDNPVKEAKRISKESGVKTLAAYDGMVVDVNLKRIDKSKITSLKDENNKLYKVERKTVEQLSTKKDAADDLKMGKSYKKDFNK